VSAQGGAGNASKSLEKPLFEWLEWRGRLALGSIVTGSAAYASTTLDVRCRLAHLASAAKPPTMAIAAFPLWRRSWARLSFLRQVSTHGRLVEWLRRLPLTMRSRVRIPLGVCHFLATFPLELELCCFGALPGSVCCVSCQCCLAADSPAKLWTHCVS